jgi:iron complex transport system permease protein
VVGGLPEPAGARGAGSRQLTRPNLNRVFVVGGLPAHATGPRLDGLALGDGIARGPGQLLATTRASGGVSVVLLCGPRPP